MNTQQRYSDFLIRAAAALPAEEVGEVRSALTLAGEKLAGMARHNGVPLMDHSVNTAWIVMAEIGLDRASIVATLLHDAVRLGLVSSRQVGETYGNEVAMIIDGMTGISGINAKITDDQADNIRELILTYSTDPRVILIKLADRLEVMRTLDIFPHEKQEKKSWESLNLYAKIAHQLGLYNVKSELEDLSLKYLHPADYNHIVTSLSESAAERDQFIAQFLVPIEQKLATTPLKYHIKSRTKSIYSIWNKMRKQGVPFEEVYDVFAIRIIIDTPREEEKNACWGAYSIVTDFYKPNTDRLRDWISAPRPNGYESLQTTVETVEGKWVEIQIRTERMDEVAERGIAAHWRYKGVKERTKEGQIYVLTPSGDIMRLGQGATVLDFAFHIHTLVGASCIGGRVNGKNVTIKHPLNNGDKVEILTSKNQRPKADWLNIVQTNRAKNKIRAHMREQEAQAADLGREELQRRLKNWKLPIAIDDAVTLLCKTYKLKTGTELYGQLADGRINIADTKEIFTRYIAGEEEDRRVHVKVPLNEAPVVSPGTSEGDETLIIDNSQAKLTYRTGKCCNPHAGDDVFGFVTVGAGITVHKTSCPNAVRMKTLYPYRVLPARWGKTNS